jgi:hypothetical protein
MSSTIRCERCGASFEEAIGPCSHCGGEVELAVLLTGVEATAQPGRPGAVADEPVRGGGQRIRYVAPSGARSESVLTGDGVQLHVEPPVDIGTRGEPRVFDRIVALLSASGPAPDVLPASDHDGEDRVIRYGSETITIQIVSAGPGPEFWRDVAKGSGQAQGNLDVPAAWVHDAIADKAGMYTTPQKRSMLLAVDLSHLGVLSSPIFVATYIQTYGDPAEESGLGAVWLVGPTDSRCTRLGTSRW